MTSSAAPYILGLILILFVCFAMLIALICCCLPEERQRKGGGRKKRQRSDSCSNDDVSVFELESTVIEDHHVVEGIQWVSSSGKTTTTAQEFISSSQGNHQPLEVIVEELSSLLLVDPDRRPSNANVVNK